MSEETDDAKYPMSGKELFGHISRGAELVILKDRDVVAFIPESASCDSLFGSGGMNIYRDSAGAKLLYTFQDGSVKSSERVLMWARISGTKLATAYRWVPYVDDDNPDKSAIKPLREVYSPRVIYDRSSNMLHLWFWTNVTWDYNDSKYDEAYIGALGFQSYAGLGTNTYKRVLCYSVGQFKHCYVNGGLFKGFTGILTPDNGGDLIPVFNKPVIINNYAPADAAHAPGIITDGVAEMQGPFDLNISSDGSSVLAKLTNCICLVGMTTVFLDDMSVDVTDASDGDFIGLELDQSETDLTKAITVTIGGAGVSYDTSFVPASQYVRTPIYKLKVINDLVSVTYRIPGIPHFMIYQS